MQTDASGELWRAQVRTRADELHNSAKLAILSQELNFVGDQVQTNGSADQQRLAAAYQDVVEATDAAKHHASQRTNPWSWLLGSLVEAAWGRLHQAESLLISLQRPEQVLGRMPEILGLVRAYLPADNTDRTALEQWWTSVNAARQTGSPEAGDAKPKLDVDKRESIIATLSEAYKSADNEHSRVRTFRNILLGTSLAIGILLVGLGLVGVTWPNAVSLCVPKPASTAPVTPAALICPTGGRLQATDGPSGGDVFLVELVGLIGAALAGVRALSASQKVAGPYSLAIAQTLLKAAAGSTTAVVGVFFLSAGVLSDIGQVQSQAAILTYAIIFGYAQQLVTGIVDKRADAVLQAASPATPPPR